MTKATLGAASPRIENIQAMLYTGGRGYPPLCQNVTTIAPLMISAPPKIMRGAGATPKPTS